MIYVEKITISPRKKVLNVGDKYRDASAVVCPSNATCKSLRWYSEDSSIAGVTGTTGYIKAIAPGKVKIYAEATDGSGVRNYIGIVVKQPVTDISLDCSNATININETKKITATVSPSNASNKNISWISCDESVATVDSNGVVTGRGMGSTTIIASACDGSGIVEYCTITVDIPVSIKKLLVKSRDGSIVKIFDSDLNESIYSIENGVIVDLIEAEPINTKWYKILYKNTNGENIIGLCSGEYLQHQRTIIEVKVKGGLYLRRTATQVHEDKINSLLEGAAALLLEENKISNEGHDYYKVHYNNMDGYITADDDEDFDLHKIWLYLASNTTVTQPITNIYVTPLNPAIGETVSLNFNIVPNNATDKSIDWKSCNESVATINSNGELTGINVGTAVIVASARDGSGVMAYITIEVTEPKSIKELRIQSSSSTTVAIKENPYDGSKTFENIANNTIVDLIEAEPQNTKWYKIYWKDSNDKPITGWCSGEYLQYEKILLEVINPDGMILRSNPSPSEFANLGSLFRASLAILSDENKTHNEGHDYYKVCYKGIDGYVTADDDSDFKLHKKLEFLFNEHSNTIEYIGDYKNFLDVLGFYESSDRYYIEKAPYLGRYMMGALALQEAGFCDSNNNWTKLASKYGVSSKEDFLNNPFAQDIAMELCHKKVWTYLDDFSKEYLGKIYQKVVITESGLLAGAHLVGAFNLMPAIRNNTVVKDDNGKPAHEYMADMSNYDISQIK